MSVNVLGKKKWFGEFLFCYFYYVIVMQENGTLAYKTGLPVLAKIVS